MYTLKKQESFLVINLIFKHMKKPMTVIFGLPDGKSIAVTVFVEQKDQAPIPTYYQPTKESLERNNMLLNGRNIAPFGIREAQKYP